MIVRGVCLHVRERGRTPSHPARPHLRQRGVDVADRH